LTETLAVLVCLLVAMTLILPALAQVGHTVPVTRSMHNLRVLHEALACYAADWNDRQFTAVPDDLGIVGGDCDDYVDQKHQMEFDDLGGSNLEAVLNL